MTADTGKKDLRSRAPFPVVFMFVLTFAVAVVLILMVRSTQEKVDANRLIQFEAAVLDAVGMLEQGATRDQVHTRFLERVEEADANSAGAYRVVENGALKAWALPISGQGFWNVIRGVIGISADGTRVLGIAFYEQSETPGLGAEIMKRGRFRNRFVGRTLAPGEKPIDFRPEGTPIEQMDANQVHAISGATQTCTRLERFLNAALVKWQHDMKLETAMQAGGTAARRL